MIYLRATIKFMAFVTVVMVISGDFATATLILATNAILICGLLVREINLIKRRLGMTGNNDLENQSTPSSTAKMADSAPPNSKSDEDDGE